MNLERLASVPPLPPRPADGHKGVFGRVLIVGGSDGMIGAPVFSGTAALRTGSGLVQLAVSRSVLGFCLSITPELIGLGLGAGAAGNAALMKDAARADAIVVGPGLGRSAAARERLTALVKLSGKPMVVDADGLNLLAAGRRWPAYFKARAVLTPHPGEMARLGKLIGRTEVPTDDDGRIDLAARAAVAFGQVVVLKGHRTVVTDGRRLYVNDTGDSTLSKAGTGDILSGMIGCLLGQGVEPFAAAAIAVHLHGLAGEIAGARLGRRCALAREIIDAIPDAVRRKSEFRNPKSESSPNVE